ncbi:hypothetical protein AB1E22_20005 [Buttiauxella gaviniae]|uniref:Uncharacterized protein n=1 Tax=Buttiauxella gaviniae TaxID=82990 RepID=A0ABV3NZJ1_9ENTR
MLLLTKEKTMATKNISNVMVCRCVAQMHEFGIKSGYRFQNVVEQLAEETGEPRKVCEAAVNRAIDAGLVEWGIHSSLGWLTNEGIEHLKTSE